MARYLWTGDGFVSRETGEPMQVNRSAICAPYVVSDTPAYVSPVTGKTIDGRSERREEMKRHDLIELPPPAKKRGVYSEKMAKKYNLPLIGRDCD
jgi:hypothetical protein